MRQTGSKSPRIGSVQERTASAGRDVKAASRIKVAVKNGSGKPETTLSVKAVPLNEEEQVLAGLPDESRPIASLAGRYNDADWWDEYLDAIEEYESKVDEHDPME